METEFLHSTLKAYETPISAALFAQIYDTIEKSTQVSDDMDDAKMTKALAQTKTNLDQAKKMTEVQVFIYIET